MTALHDSAGGKMVRIGGASAFIADSALGPRQLIDVDGMQYLVFDYLAEMTLSSFARARSLDAAAGYAVEFIDTLRDILPRCADRGIRLVANAGGVNPRACAAAVDAVQKELGTSMRVAFVEGDDGLPVLPALRKLGVTDFYSGAPMPTRLDSANAYLGAFPIAAALDAGAQIVITGRIVDSATTLGILIHEYGWTASDFDLLAAGSLAGHILECGCQATGGIHTDWRDVPDWENIGYPIVDFTKDGTFCVTKPPGTGGLVNVATVAEQILYEVGDPARYVLPDVVCDLTQVRVQQYAPDRVQVRGVKGGPPPPSYKASATYQHGYRCAAQLSIFGLDAVAKAERTGQALLNRVRKLLREAGHADFEKTHVSVLGAEQSYGPHADLSLAPREAMARVAVMHPCAEALALFARESRAPGVSWAPGTTSGSSLTLNTKPAIEPVYRLFSFLVDKSLMPAPRYVMDGIETPVPVSTGADARAAPAAPASTGTLEPQADRPVARASADGRRKVPLIEVAYARCGDKGDLSNIAVFARRREYLLWLEAELTPAAVADYLSHVVTGPVTRYPVPGLHAWNFVLQGALDGGGPTSLRPDPLGKGMAQMLLGMEINVPEDFVPVKP